MTEPRLFKTFHLLLPRAKAFTLHVSRVFREFFLALSEFPSYMYEHILSVILELFPSTTSQFSLWSEIFGSPEVLNATELGTEWSSTGGQSPGYLQDILQAAGFNVWVHEWWVPGSAPPVARNPIPYVETSRVLVNDLGYFDKDYIFQFGAENSQFQSDGEVYFGAFDGYAWFPKRYPTPDNPEEYPTYFYVCAETWPQYADIPEAGLHKLIRLIYKHKPLQLRCILRVRLLEDGDILDSIIADDDLQDIIAATDDLQDTV